MRLANYSQEERDHIHQALGKIIAGPFVPDGGEAHTYKSFRCLSCKSRVSVIRYA